MSMAAVAIGTTAATVGAGMYSSNKASKAQRAAADKASATELAMFDQSRQDQMPWMETGKEGLNELAYRLGLNGSGPGTAASSGSRSAPNLVNQLLVDTSSGVPQYNIELYNNNPAYKAAWDAVAAEHDQRMGRSYNEYSGAQWIEDRVRERLPANEMDSAKAAQEAEMARRAADPEFGSLLKNFTEQDFWADPVTKLGFQFGMDEGTKGLNRQLSASGGLNSGAQAKALARFATDYAGTKGNESFNRFNINKDSTFNKLASLAGVGQTASQQMGNQAIATGQSVGNNIIGAGNARAAGYIGQANALNSAIGQGYNMYQSNQMMNLLGNQRG